VLVSVVGWVLAPEYWESVAEVQPRGGMSDIPTGRTQNNANPEVPVATQHPVHGSDCGSQTAHTRGNQNFEPSVAVLVNSATELMAVDYHRQ